MVYALLFIDIRFQQRLSMVEAKALDGAKETIKKYLPKLYVCAYHRNEDMYALPQKIKDFDSRYNVYFRHHPYIPAWESNFYAVIDDNK